VLGKLIDIAKSISDRFIEEPRFIRCRNRELPKPEDPVMVPDVDTTTPPTSCRGIFCVKLRLGGTLPLRVITWLL
jgi:hypothetical protein